MTIHEYLLRRASRLYGFVADWTRGFRHATREFLCYRLFGRLLAYKALVRARSRIAAEFDTAKATLRRPIVQGGVHAEAITLVVTVGSTPSLVFQCLRRLVDSGHLNVDLWVLSNGLSAESLRVIRAFVPAFRELRLKPDAYVDAARNASCERIVLIGDAVEPFAERLRNVVRRMENDQKIGAVVGRLSFPHGRVLEAGCEAVAGNDVWSNAGERNDSPPVMFRRKVDHGSADFLLTTKAALTRAGRALDPRLSRRDAGRAYCRELRDAGYSVLYDPDLSGTLLSRQRIWGRTDRGRRSWERRTHKRLQRDENARGNALVIEDRVPHVRLGSGYPRAAAMINALSLAGYGVTLFPMFDPAERWAEIHETLNIDVEVMLGSGAGALPRFLRDRAGFYDLCIVSRPHNMKLAKSALEEERCRNGKMRLVYDAEAMYCLREVGLRRLQGHEICATEIAELVRNEVSLTEGADAILAVSPSEADRFRIPRGPSVHVVRHHIAAAPTPAEFYERQGFLFVGAIHGLDLPNADSLVWFFTKVLGSLRVQLGGEFKCTIAGTNTVGLDFSYVPGVRQLGEVGDLQRVYNDARVFIAPTRFAAGVPLKVYEAAAAGVPVVATSLLADQLGWSTERELLVADNAEEYAVACARLHSDNDLWRSVREQALGKVAEECSEQAFREALERGISVPA